MSVASGAVIPLKGVRLDARIRNLFCDVTVEQSYENNERQPIEAVYTFPLPLDAVLLDVEVTLGDKKLRGEVVPKSEAERRYEGAIAQGNAAIRLELVEPGIYAMNLGNLLPGEAASIRFRYGQLLRWNGNSVRFQVPTTLAPRYGEPQMAPHHVPPVSILAENQFTLSIAVSGVLASAAIDCPTHRLTTRQRNGAVEMGLTAGKSFMDRDVVLNFELGAGTRSCAVVVSHGEGQVALLSWRPSFPRTGSIAPRAVKIVVDCSGSMAGDSIAQAGLALAGIIESLRPQDCFEIIRFGSSHQMLFGALTPANERSRNGALALARELKADLGGTEIGAALKAAYKIKGGGAEARPDVLLITDGEINDTVPVLKAARDSGHRIFTVGVGASVAEPFVLQLAADTGGACELVTPNEDMAGRIIRHFQRMHASRASNVRIHWPATAKHEIPSQFPAVFDGDTLHAFAWLPTKAVGDVRVQLTLEDGSVLNESISCGAIDAGEPVAIPGHPIARMAAAAWIAEAPKDAQQIALDHQLLTATTDFIVVYERAQSEKANGLPALRSVAHMLAAGWGGVGSVLLSPAPMMDREMTFAGDSQWRSWSVDASSFEPAALMEVRMPNETPLTREAWTNRLNRIESRISFDSATGCLYQCDFDLVNYALITTDLRELLLSLIQEGNDEYQIILALLVVLARLPVGDQFSREAKRMIEKAADGLTLGERTLAAIEQAVNQAGGSVSQQSEAVGGVNAAG
jgi:Ca-activated chloride channel family protein